MSNWYTPFMVALVIVVVLSGVATAVFGLPWARTADLNRVAMQQSQITMILSKTVNTQAKIVQELHDMHATQDGLATKQQHLSIAVAQDQVRIQEIERELDPPHK